MSDTEISAQEAKNAYFGMLNTLGVIEGTDRMLLTMLLNRYRINLPLDLAAQLPPMPVLAWSKEFCQVMLGKYPGILHFRTTKTGAVVAAGIVDELVFQKIAAVFQGLVEFGEDPEMGPGAIGVVLDPLELLSRLAVFRTFYVEVVRQDKNPFWPHDQAGSLSNQGYMMALTRAGAKPDEVLDSSLGDEITFGLPLPEELQETVRTADDILDEMNRVARLLDGPEKEHRMAELQKELTNLKQ